MALFFRFDLWRNRGKQRSSILGLYATITPTGAAQRLRPYRQILICAYVCVCVCVCVCACTQSINVFLCLCQIQSVFFFFFFFFFLGSSKTGVGGLNKKHPPFTTLFKSQGLMGRCRGQTSSEEDSPSYKRGPFSQWWANETDSLFVCVCVCFVCIFMRRDHGEIKTWRIPSLWALFFFLFMWSWTEEIWISCGYVCVCVFFFFFFLFCLEEMCW